MFSRMPDTLANYPYVAVRLDCTMCSRGGAYRLARLADKYGAEIDMRDLLALLAGDCKYWRPRHPGVPGCGARFPDLEARRPPDLPPGAGRMRVVK
jgi:hypothetical protein